MSFFLVITITMIIAVGLLFMSSNPYVVMVCGTDDDRLMDISFLRISPASSHSQDYCYYDMMMIVM